MDSNKALEEAYNMITSGNSKIVYIWITQIVFNWHWWLGVALSIFPWIIWVKIREKIIQSGYSL